MNPIHFNHAGKAKHSLRQEQNLARPSLKVPASVEI
jgi:hypothetical protein